VARATSSLSATATAVSSPPSTTKKVWRSSLHSSSLSSTLSGT
jgi:hypothetical protein